MGIMDMLPAGSSPTINNGEPLKIILSCHFWPFHSAIAGNMLEAFLGESYLTSVMLLLLCINLFANV